MGGGGLASHIGGLVLLHINCTFAWAQEAGSLLVDDGGVRNFCVWETLSSITFGRLFCT